VALLQPGTRSATTSSFALRPNTSYLLLVSRVSSAGDSITHLASAGLRPALSTASFTRIGSHSFAVRNWQWAYFVRTGPHALGSGTLTARFAKPASPLTVLDLVSLGPSRAVGGVGTSSGSRRVAAAVVSPAASRDALIVLLTAERDLGASAPASFPAGAEIFFSHHAAGSASIDAEAPATKQEWFLLPAKANWGSLAVEIRPG
jgi:hypothetical protein